MNIPLCLLYLHFLSTQQLHFHYLHLKMLPLLDVFGLSGNKIYTFKMLQIMVSLNTVKNNFIIYKFKRLWYEGFARFLGLGMNFVYGTINEFATCQDQELKKLDWKFYFSACDKWLHVAWNAWNFILILTVWIIKVSLLWANNDPEEHITKIHEAILILYRYKMLLT